MSFDTASLTLAAVAAVAVTAAVLADRYDAGAAINLGTVIPGAVLGLAVLAACSYVAFFLGVAVAGLGVAAAWVWSVRRRAGRGQGPAATVGHVWWAWLPFEEKSGGKDRPVLVVSDDGGRHVLVRKITSQDPPRKVAGEYTAVSWNGSGKSRSWCRTGGSPSRIPRSNLRRQAGVAYRV